MKLGIIRLYSGKSGRIGYYNIQEIGLAKALAKRGIETDIFFLVNKKVLGSVSIKQICERVRVIYIPATTIYNHGIVSPDFIVKYKIDIVHLLSDNQIMVPRINRFCKDNDIPIYNYIGTLESDTKNNLKKFIMNIISERNVNIYRNSNLVVKSPYVKKQLEKHGIEKSQLIPVGLDLDNINSISKSKDSIREELGIINKKKVLLFVGRLEEYKDPIKAIELMKELKKNSNDYLLIMIGKGSLKEKIYKLINKNRLEKDVIIIDEIKNSDIHKYYCSCDFLLNFNSKEIFGMSILEAMYQGSKVIAVDAPGPSYIIENNIDGIIINDYDTTKWIKKIEDNMNNDIMSEKARKKIINKFNWDIIAERYLELFEKVQGK